MMRRPILGLAAILAAAALAGASTAIAVPIKECGNPQHLINGYQQMLNVTSRNVPCRIANSTGWKIENQVLDHGFGSNSDKVHLRSHGFHWRGWTIRTRWYQTPGLPTYVISQDVRSTASRGRVIHYQVVGE